jgi:uncharacterized membrane protein YgcG
VLALLAGWLLLRRGRDQRPSAPAVIAGVSRRKNEFAGPDNRVEAAVHAEAMRRGWFTDRTDWTYGKAWWTGAAVTVVGAVLIVLAAGFTRLGLVPIPIVVLGLALVMGAERMPHRTGTGKHAAGPRPGPRRSFAYRRVRRAFLGLSTSSSSGGSSSGGGSSDGGGGGGGGGSW